MIGVLARFALALAVVSPLAAVSRPAPITAVSPDIVVSQVYGGGGNTGATYTHDYIELINRGTAAVNITGWSVQFASATGTTWSKTDLNGTLLPGQYYLVQQAAGTGGTTALPTPDAIGTIPMSGTAGKVALANNTTPLTGSCPLAGAVDLVGYGTAANCFEGTGPTATLSNTTAAIRLNNGCTENDQNSTDFTTVGGPTPRNSASPVALCVTPTNPSGVGAASPDPVTAGNSTLLTVAVSAGTNPASTGLAVTADLAQIGGSATQALVDDGTNGDLTPGDLTFSWTATVAPATAVGAKVLPVSITDAQSRNGTATINLTVQAPATTTVTTTVTVTAPPFVDAGGPYTIEDGASVEFVGVASDPDGGSVTLAWDFDDDGDFDDATGPTPTYDTALFGTPGSNPIAVQATDDESTTSTDTTTVTVTVGAVAPSYLPPPGDADAPATGGILASESVLQIRLPEAAGGKTVFGNLASAQAAGPGFVTAYPCLDGPPVDGDGNFTKSDLNFNGAVLPAMSNRLVTTADANGDICFYTSIATALIVDINATADKAITPLDNQRTDTRQGDGVLPADSVLTVNVAEAAGGKTVFGNLASAQAAGPGFVTAYPCLDGPPVDGDGNFTKSDLNFNGAVLPAMSNRLVTTADANGDICFYTSIATALIVDINATADEAITPLDNQRTDTRQGDGVLPADSVLTVNVAEAAGGKTVFGNLASAQAAGPGFVTAYPCLDGPPVDGDGNFTKSDLNFNGAVLPAMSNRLVTTADANGDICFYTSIATALIVDINATADEAITPLDNQRTDTRFIDFT